MTLYSSHADLADRSHDWETVPVCEHACLVNRMACHETAAVRAASLFDVFVDHSDTSAVLAGSARKRANCPERMRAVVLRFVGIVNWAATMDWQRVTAECRLSPKAALALASAHQARDAIHAIHGRPGMGMGREYIHWAQGRTGIRCEWR